MTAPGWDNAAWQRIQGYEEVWTPFDRTFDFRPGMDPATWPAIAEPPGSVTIDLTPIFVRKAGGFAADESVVNQQTLDALVDTFAEDEPLVALSWQHQSYRFWPHRQARSRQPWRIPPFPNDDYVIFLTEDLEQGTFGHPWEETICVFGGGLVDALIPRLAEWLPIKRTS